MELEISYRELSELNQTQKGRCHPVCSFEDSRLANVYMKSRRGTVWKEAGEEPEGRSGVREDTEHACENDPSPSETNRYQTKTSKKQEQCSQTIPHTPDGVLLK